MNGTKSNDELSDSNQKTMQIIVKTLVGKSLTLEFNENDTIEIVKHKILEIEHVPLDKQILHTNGMKLENDKTLSFYGLKEGDKIYMALPHIR